MSHPLQTVNGTGLNRDSLPIRLWEKAKIYGIWNPADIDFTQDKIDFQNLSEKEQEYLIQPIAQFQAGEEAVTLDLLPLMLTVAKEGRLEEEMFLTTFLWEEAKHVDGFNLFLKTVLGKENFKIDHHLVNSYKTIFYDILPKVMNELLVDPSPVNQVKASVTYNMIVEGTLAETGYHILNKIVKEQNIMPGLYEFTAKLKQDESRHIAYGIYLISRLVAEHGDEVWQAVEQQMDMLIPLVINVINESYDLWDEPPFGLDKNEIQAYTLDQFQKRYAKIQKARNQSLEELNTGILTMENE